MDKHNKKIGKKVQKGGVFSKMAASIGTGVGSLGKTIRSSTEPLGDVMGKIAENAKAGVGPGKIAKMLGSDQAGDFYKDLKEIGKEEQTEDKLNSLRSSKFADAIIWDLLYEEPCWIDPEQNMIVLSKLKYLWCNFQNKEIDKLLSGGSDDDKEIKITDINACRDEYFKSKYGKSPDEVNMDVEAHDDFNRLIAKIRKPVLEVGDDLKDAESYNRATKVALEELEEHCPNSIEVASFDNAADMTNLIFNPAPPGGDPTKASGGDANSKCNYKKWVFCFIFKFITGPGGFFLIKMIPHFIKFLYNLKDFFIRIFGGLMNTLRAIPGFSNILGPKTFYTYYGKIHGKKPILDENGEDTGETERDRSQDRYGFKTYQPNFFDTLFSYFGTVIPMHIFSYNLGQKYGKGEFGKLIFGLVIVSAVIIIIGGVGITMLFLCFAFYCLKTVSMFSDNIKEKGKGKA